MNKTLKRMLFSVKRQKIKRSIPLFLFLMAVIVCTFTPGINQTAFAQDYVKVSVGGTATASSEDSPASLAFDSDEYTRWGSEPLQFIPGDNLPYHWLQYQIPSPQIVTRYRISTYDMAAEVSLYGSNNGSSWTHLHSISSSQLGQYINFSNTTAYSYYRIVTTGNGECFPIPFPPGVFCFSLADVTEFELYAIKPSINFSYDGNGNLIDMDKNE